MHEKFIFSRLPKQFLDITAADDLVAPIENGGLAGRRSANRPRKLNFCPTAGQITNQGWIPPAAVADFDFRFKGRIPIVRRRSAQAVDKNFGSLRPLIGQYHPIVNRVDLPDK